MGIFVVLRTSPTRSSLRQAPWLNPDDAALLLLAAVARTSGARAWLVGDGEEALPADPRWEGVTSTDPADRAALHRIGVEVALERAGPGDVVYLAEWDHLHRPGALGVLREGLREVDAHYVTLHDEPSMYWPRVGGGTDDDDPTADPDPGDGEPELGELGGPATGRSRPRPVVVSRSCHWHLRAALPPTYGCRRSVLEADRDLIDATFPDPPNADGLRRFWAGLAGRGRILRGSLPAHATLSSPDRMAPCFSWHSLVNPTVPLDPRRVEEVFDVMRDRVRPLAVALLPGLSEEFERDLRATFVNARLVAVSNPEDAVRGGFDAVAVTDLQKDRLDEILRRSPGIATVFVDIVNRDPGLSIRWMYGRDWALPAFADRLGRYDL